MKSLNWISGTGRRPYIAMPMAAPTMPASASGVSMTRSGPNSSYSPAVARKTPPNFPTSSPSTTTRGSRRISTRSASLTAWIRFQSGMSAAVLCLLRDCGLALLFEPSLDEELARLVRAAHQGTGGDEPEPERQPLLLQVPEHLGPDVLLDGQVLLRRPQVLAEGEDVAADRTQVAHRLQHLVAPLAEAEHDGRLGPHAAALVVRQHLERLAVRGAAVAHAWREPLDGLHVVRGHGGLRVDDHVQGRGVALEVGREDFDERAWCRAAQLDDRLGEVRSAAVRQLVAVHAGHHQVVEAE